ncbi:MAG TPA: MBL fold metallo-hydrolase [Ktedonobacterales bacterium]|nr:MBL fold metallo-hydrolase [Ktedonobacterales bacterium]
MRVVSLASGSSGNALVVRAGQTTVLVDAGLGPRILAARLKEAGIAASDVSAVLLTHEHSDHTCGARAFARKYGVPLLSDPRTLAALTAYAEPGVSEAAASVERIELAVGRETRHGDLNIRSFAVSHDAVAPCGYLLSTGAWSVLFATDTGEATGPMLEMMRLASLLVIESNHDIDRLRLGPYPAHLKRRILSPTGHLSNEQTSQALLTTLDESPRWVWLAHLSRTNNTPDIARAHVRQRLRERGLGHVQVQVNTPGLGPSWDSASLLSGGPAQHSLWSAPASVKAPAPSAVTMPERS